VQENLSVILSLIAVLSAAVLTGCIHKDVPNEQKLVDCTNGTLRFSMTVQDYPPYQFLLGESRMATGTVSFRGEMIIGQSTGIVAQVRIGSNDMTPCSWLDREGLRGYILTWSRTNQLRSFLIRNQTYDMEVRFSEEPPSACSLWLSTMRRVGL